MVTCRRSVTGLPRGVRHVSGRYTEQPDAQSALVAGTGVGATATPYPIGALRSGAGVADTGVVLLDVDAPHFLALYGVSAGAALLVALLGRWLLSAGVSQHHKPTTLDLAYVNGRLVLACQVCVVGLRRAGAIDLGVMSTLVSTGPSPTWAPPLMAALHRSLRAPRSWPEVLGDVDVLKAGWQIERRLVRRGWLLSPTRKRAMKLATAPLFAVAVFGLLGLAPGVIVGAGAARHPVAVVSLILAVAATFLIGWLLLDVPEVSRTARRVQREARRSAGQARDAGRSGQPPAPTQQLMRAVALHGSPSLHAADPALATHIGVRRAKRGPFPRDDSLSYPVGGGL